MILENMEDCSSLFPSLFLEDTFQLDSSYDNWLYGRKKKKKESLDVADCRLDSPCNSPEVIMGPSGGVEDGIKRCQNLLHSDGFTIAQDSDYGSTFGGVDMEGFYEISARMTAAEDIMLSSSAEESKLVLKQVAVSSDLPKLVVHSMHSVSCNGGSADDKSRLQFENDVDVLIDNCLQRNEEQHVSLPAHDLLADLSDLAVSGYLLSDIPSHPDLSGEASDSLLTFCPDKDECSSSSSVVQHTKSVKCNTDVCTQDPCDTVDSDYDALCTDTLLDDMQTNMNDYPRITVCRCLGYDCLCYKSDTSSAEEEDACIEYIVSQSRANVRKPNSRSSHMVRRGPGRPRKLQNTEFIRRGPGRPRKKSVSDAVVWYQTRRKRTVSFSNSCKSRCRQKCQSEEKGVSSVSNVAHVSVSTKRSYREVGVQISTDCQPSHDTQRSLSLETVETGIKMLCKSEYTELCKYGP